jgi:hypothetical protein
VNLPPSASAAETIHTGENMKVSDRALNRLKAEREGAALMVRDGARPL